MKRLFRRRSSSETKAGPNVAIVGAGAMGRWHAYAARRAGATILAIVDPDQRSAKTLAKRHRGAAVFADLATMLTEQRPEVVHVCTPLPTHAPLAQQSIDAGIHALVEKPLTNSSADAQRLYQAARSKGVLLCPTHQFLFQDGVASLGSTLDSWGDPLFLRFTAHSAGGMGRPAAALDGVVGDILPHPLSLLLDLWPGHELGVDDWSLRHPRNGELLIQGHYAEIGVQAYISMHARPTCCTLDVVCREGSVHVDLFHGYAVVEHGGVSRLRKLVRPLSLAGKMLLKSTINLARRAKRKEPAYPGLMGLTQAFYAAVEAGADAPILAEDSLAVVAARERIMQRTFPIPSGYPTI